VQPTTREERGRGREGGTERGGEGQGEGEGEGEGENIREIKNQSLGASVMAQWLTVLVALAKDLGSVSASTSGSSQLPLTPAPTNLTSFDGLCRHLNMS
jgi:hypothetical protein